jgi:hypothetical protein
MVANERFVSISFHYICSVILLVNTYLATHISEIDPLYTRVVTSPRAIEVNFKDLPVVGEQAIANFLKGIWFFYEFLDFRVLHVCQEAFPVLLLYIDIPLSEYTVLQVKISINSKFLNALELDGNKIFGPLYKFQLMSVNVLGPRCT